LESRALQVEVSNSKSREREKKGEGDSVCSQTTKDTAKEKASISYMGKGVGVLQ